MLGCWRTGKKTYEMYDMKNFLTGFYSLTKQNYIKKSLCFYPEKNLRKQKSSEEVRIYVTSAGPG